MPKYLAVSSCGICCPFNVTVGQVSRFKEKVTCVDGRDGKEKISVSVWNRSPVFYLYAIDIMIDLFKATSRFLET
jgi:hypothetical protein